MWTCKHCNNSFNFERLTEKANHGRHCDKNPKRQQGYNNVKHALQSKYEMRVCEIKEFEVKCECCEKMFIVKEREKVFPKKEKYFCSRSCANSAGGKAKALIYHSDETAHYSTVARRHHEKCCIVCGEDKIVAVHHVNLDHLDNDPKNLVILCPTHHHYVHSKFRYLVQPAIDSYILNRWKN